jgi:glutamate-1-semialdehyde 2,1-aminomutase
MVLIEEKVFDKELKDKIHSLIPGGAHTYSRGDDQSPISVPAVFEKGKGAYVWDTHGNRYLDYGMGLRAVTIGYAQEEIDKAAIEGIKKGNNMPKASLTELKAAEKILSVFPGMDMVKFAKNGSTVTTAAVKLARAYTGKKLIVRCAEHPFFSYDDWFIGDTIVNRGVPEEISKLTLRFNFNDINSLKKVFKENKDKIACVALEPTTHVEPEPGFLKELEELTHENNALIISDEVSCCFRIDYATYDRYGFMPDMVTIGKGIANGYSVDALLGKKEVMELGGTKHKNGERVFLISTTFGGEMSSLSAMMATVDFFKKHNVLEHLWSYNKKLIKEGTKIAEQLGIEDKFHFEGFPGRFIFLTKDQTGKDSLAFKTLFLQEMLKHEVFVKSFICSYSHKEKELELTLDAMEKSLNIYKKALNEGVDKYLVGRPMKPVFRKFN